jgi:hypothetical protein
MICRGHVPMAGQGGCRVNKDVLPFILYFLPKGQKLTKPNLVKVVKHFHLAFKDMDTSEVYDVLIEQLVQAINRYDPNYKDKVKRVCEVIDNELSRQFTGADIDRHLGINSHRYIRLLVCIGFFQSVQEGPGSKVVRYARAGSWPSYATFRRPG